MPQRRRNGGRNKGGGPQATGALSTHHHRTPTPSPPPAHGHFPLYYYAVTPTTAVGLTRVRSCDGLAASSVHPPYQCGTNLRQASDEHWASSFASVSGNSSASHHGSSGSSAPGPSLEAPEYVDMGAGVSHQRAPPPTPPLPPRLFQSQGSASMVRHQMTQQQHQQQQQQQQAWPPTSMRSGGRRSARRHEWAARPLPTGDVREGRSHNMPPSEWLIDPSASGGPSGEARRKEDLEARTRQAADTDARGPHGDTGSYFCNSSNDIDSIRPHVSGLELATQAAAGGDRTRCAAAHTREDRGTLEKQLRIIMQQKAAIAQKTAANAQLEERLASAEVALSSKERELLKSQGHAETLRALPAGELTTLAESLVESLLRIQREHQRKFAKQRDEQLCAVCFTERKDVVLRPCNHLTVCTKCFDNKCTTICPQCRTQVTGHLKIYL